MITLWHYCLFLLKRHSFNTWLQTRKSVSLRYGAGKTDLILMSLLRLCKEELNTFYFLQHTLTVVLRWLEIRVRAGVGAGAGVGRAGLDRLNPHKREKEKKNLNLSNPQNQHKAQWDRSIWALYNITHRRPWITEHTQNARWIKPTFVWTVAGWSSAQTPPAKTSHATGFQ